MLKRIINWLDRGRCECGRSFWYFNRWYKDGESWLCYECWERQNQELRQRAKQHDQDVQGRLDTLGACLMPSGGGRWLLLIERGQLRADAPWVAELWAFAQGQQAEQA